MPITYTLIASTSLSSGAANVTFSGIPNTYTDLKLVISARTNRASDEDSVGVAFNDTSGSTGWLLLFNNGSSLTSGTSSSLGYGGSFLGRVAAASTTPSNIFSNLEAYIPEYASSSNKTFSTTGGFETSGSNPYSTLLLSMRTLGAAISQILIVPGNGTQLVANSSFYLYGIKKA
jgi:hypothetical protein